MEGKTVAVCFVNLTDIDLRY